MMRKNVSTDYKI